MIRTLIISAWLCLAASLASAQSLTYTDSPSLRAAVDAGRLAPVAARLPENPLVIELAQSGKTVGRYGGTMRMLMARPKDVRLMTVYGYARLMRYDSKLNIVPDILERIAVEDGRVFTLTLRAGHKWSDGAPFTAEDFRYY